jgi:hypothetical protein
MSAVAPPRSAAAVVDALISAIRSRHASPLAPRNCAGELLPGLLASLPACTGAKVSTISKALPAAHLCQSDHIKNLERRLVALKSSNFTALCSHVSRLCSHVSSVMPTCGSRAEEGCCGRPFEAQLDWFSSGEICSPSARCRFCSTAASIDRSGAPAQAGTPAADETDSRSGR